MMTPEELAAIKERCDVADVPRLLAEVERLQSIVDAAKAYRASHAAIYDVRKHEPNTDFYLLFSDKWVAECKLFAAIDAAEGGG